MNAREYAIQHPKDQLYGGKPYSYHLDMVAGYVESYGAEYITAAYLHDVVEDTDVTLEDIEQIFGVDIKEALYYLTDEPGTNRKDRKKLTNQKFSTCNNNVALVVKAADRLGNMSTAQGSLLAMYMREYADFRASVYRPGLCDELWLELDTLASRYQ